MKQEKWITVVLCAVMILGAGGFYLGSRQAVQKKQTGFISGSTEVERYAETYDLAKESPVADHSEKESASKQTEYAVYICGAVKHPGVYHFAYMARVCDVIEAAGGLKKNAAATSVNQARYIMDGEQIQILTKKQAKSGQLQDGQDIPPDGDGDVKQGSASALVNINQATEAELMTLSGIGQSKAKAIIDYRTQNGSFKSVEDIKKVAGIKEGVYKQIKDSITV